ncbi:MAG: SDR family oxidoreductase [Oligoflexia bacterium]|nr:SDR family oxidoreductase [Oligoflexia bacterium]
MAQHVLKGWNALVTGGASGMGAAIALQLARAGANVAIGSRLSKQSKSTQDAGLIAHFPDAADLEHMVNTLRSCGVETIASSLDVTQPDSIDQICQLIEKTWGSIDILVTAAGVSTEHTLCDHPLSTWDQVIDVNLTGTALSIRRVLPGMLKQSRGRIITIASTAASVGAARSAAYCASKAGVVALTRCVALEAAAHNITCNSISPTWVDTPLAGAWMEECARIEKTQGGSSAYRKSAEAGNPQGRLITPEEIADLALFLCTPGARGITGQDITVSGGSLW